ncbi:hypothetical protein GO001_12100 [Streptomyces sp. NRRL B-1677]|nr:hypothetical protein [Streptomyces sp. NRRL B-1677]
MRLLSVEFGHLPAPHLSVSDIFPDLLDLSFHGNLGAFEAWRDALGLLPDTVSHHEQGDGRTRVLSAEGTYAGARVRLTGFSKNPAAGMACAREESGP